MERASQASGVRGLISVCLATALSVALCGCAVVGERYVFEEQITENRVRMIRHGETTKKEILDWLGPPAAVAREDAPAAGAPAIPQRFTTTGGAVKDRVIYCYQTSGLVWLDLCLFGTTGGGCWASTPVMKTQKLWILIDDRAGKVVDHFLEETEREESDVKITPWLGPSP